MLGRTSESGEDALVVRVHPMFASILVQRLIRRTPHSRSLTIPVTHVQSTGSSVTPVGRVLDRTGVPGPRDPILTPSSTGNLGPLGVGKQGARPVASEPFSSHLTRRVSDQEPRSGFLCKQSSLSSSLTPPART